MYKLEVDEELRVEVDCPKSEKVSLILGQNLTNVFLICQSGEIQKKIGSIHI